MVAGSRKHSTGNSNKLRNATKLSCYPKAKQAFAYISNLTFIQPGKVQSQYSIKCKRFTCHSALRYWNNVSNSYSTDIQLLAQFKGWEKRESWHIHTRRAVNSFEPVLQGCFMVSVDGYSFSWKDSFPSYGETLTYLARGLYHLSTAKCHWPDL